MTNGQDMLDRGMIHGSGRTERGGVRVHHPAQNGAQFKIHELFIFEIFRLIFLDRRLTAGN